MGVIAWFRGMADVMKNRIRMIAAVAVFLVASEMYSQAQAPPFSLKLDVTPSNAKTGANFVIEVDLTNNTNKLMQTEVCLGWRVECNFKIYVGDSHGNSPPETRSQMPPAASIAGTSVEPGQTIKFFSDQLTKFFDLSRPDRYEVQVERFDSYTNRNVRSNVSHVTVSAQ